MWRDLQFAVRLAGNARTLAAATVLTLALGTGAASSIFSLLYATVFRPLPFAEPDRLVVLYATRTSPRGGLAELRWSRPAITALAPHLTSYEDVGSYSRADVSLAGTGDPEQLQAEMISSGYLRALRVQPVAGRLFTPEEDLRPGEPELVIISDRLWRRRFGGDAHVVGTTVRINQVPMTIAGVLPRGFAGLSGAADVWLPFTMAPRLTYGEYWTTRQHFINLVGRLKTSVPLERANLELATLVPSLDLSRTFEDEPVSWSALARPLGDARVDAVARRSAMVLVSAVGCLLLIAWVNLTMMLLARGGARRSEMAVRLALGATRWRLARQLMTEALALALAGGALGTLMAAWAIPLAARLDPAVIASPQNDYGQLAAFAAPRLEPAVALFIIGVTIATAAAIGIVPALTLSRAASRAALRDGARSSGVPGTRRLMQGLVAGQVTLAVPLAAAAGLLLTSYVHMREAPAAGESERVLAFRVSPPASRYPPESGPAIVHRVLTEVQRVPGIESAAVNRCVPFDSRCSRTLAFFPGRTTDEAAAPAVGRHYVSPDYFRTIGIPLLRGRLLDDGDVAGRPPVAVINESAARRFWPGEDPIGQSVWFGSAFTDPEHPVVIVGVVGDVKYWPLDQPVGPDFYTSYRQYALPDTLVLVKSRAEAAAIVPALRHAVARADDSLPIYDVHTLADGAASALARPRFNAAVSGLFAFAAVALVVLGVYGLLSYAVASRRREFALRLALGADPRALARDVVRSGLAVAAVGAFSGVVVSVAVLRTLRHLAYGLSPTDARLILAIAVVVLLAAASATAAPARRAARTDAAEALRLDP